jgi:hypothetical protein
MERPAVEKLFFYQYLTSSRDNDKTGKFATCQRGASAAALLARTDARARFRARVRRLIWPAHSRRIGAINTAVNPSVFFQQLRCCQPLVW